MRPAAWSSLLVIAVIVIAAALLWPRPPDPADPLPPLAREQPPAPPFAQPPSVPVEPWQEALVRTTVSLAMEQSFCTGTWLSPHAVLTAAHCVEGQSAGTFSIVPSPVVSSPPVKLRTGAIFIHPSYRAALEAAGGAPVNPWQVSIDLAVVTVPGGMPPGAKVAILDFEHSVKPDSLQYVAGYGHTGVRSDGVAEGLGVLRSAQFKTLYKFNNAHPGDGSASPAPPGAGAAPVGFYWTLDGENRAELCTGDSGGPAFWVSGNTMMQFGVNSYIMVTTREGAARHQRIMEQQQRGELVPLEDLRFVSGLLDAVQRLHSRRCSPLMTVASIGEHRDWLTERRDEIERAATLLSGQ